MKKKIIALLLSASMAFTLCSPVSMAAEDMDMETEITAEDSEPEEPSEEQPEEQSEEPSEEQIVEASDETPEEQIVEASVEPSEEQSVETPVEPSEGQTTDAALEDALTVDQAEHVDSIDDMGNPSMDETIGSDAEEENTLIVTPADDSKSEAIVEVLELSEADEVQSYDISAAGELDGSADVTISFDDLGIPEGALVAEVTVYHFLDSAEAIEASDDELTEKYRTKEYASEFALETDAAQEYNSELQNDTVFVETIQPELDQETNEIHFSISSCSTFTVDFHYKDLTYSIPGESGILLSELFEKIGYTDHTAAQAISVAFSDPSLVKVEEQENDWLLTSLKAFQTNETLTVEFDDGEILEIPVTDETVTYLLNFKDNNIIAYWTMAAYLGNLTGSFEPTVYLYGEGDDTEDSKVSGVDKFSYLHMLSDKYWFEVNSTTNVITWAMEYVEDVNCIEFIFTILEDLTAIFEPEIHITRHSTELSFEKDYGTIRQKSEFVKSEEDTVERTVEIHINGSNDIAESKTFRFPNRNDNNELKTDDIASIETNDNYVKRSDVIEGASDVTISEDGANYQIWLYTKYQVQFDPNGGVGAMNTQTFVYGEEKELAENAYAKNCKVTFDLQDGSEPSSEDVTSQFEGWATKADGDKVYEDKQSVSNLSAEAGDTVTLYAVWSSESVALPTPTREATEGSDVTYRFLGWYTAADESGEKVEGDTYIPTRDITLYAHWEVLATLTINKIVNDNCAPNPNQMFLFAITKKDDPDFRMTVMVPQDGEVTIHDVPLGTYYVQENCEWSWLYPQEENVYQQIEVTEKKWNQEVQFEEGDAHTVSWLTSFSEVIQKTAQTLAEYAEGGTENE